MSFKAYTKEKEIVEKKGKIDQKPPLSTSKNH